MNVLLLTTSFPLLPTGSSGIFVERLAQHLGGQCHLHVLAPAACVAPEISGDRTYKLSTFSYAPSRWQVLSHESGGIPAALSANPLLWFLVPIFIISMGITCAWQARHADLIFANWSICGVVAGIVGRLYNRPVVTTLRGEDANRLESSHSHRLLIKLCLLLSGRVVTVSNDIADRIRTSFPSMKDKVLMIPNGVDLIPINHIANDDAKSDQIHLLILGSLIPRKSIQTAFQAMAKLPKEFFLTIVGDGTEREALTKLTKNLGIDHRVNFAGKIPPKHVPTYLKKADILVMTSRSEGRPNAVLEAMAAGMPIVCSDIPGHRELVTPDVNGEFFPVGDAKSLVECLLTMSNSSRRQRLGAASYDSIIERGLTWENTAKMYLKQFKILHSKSKR